MCGEPEGGLHRLAVVNDTLGPASGNVTVSNIDDGSVLLEAAFDVPANGLAEVGQIQEETKPAMWLIEYTVGDTLQRNHYLAGPRPFDLDQFRLWLTKLHIPSEIFDGVPVQ